MPNVYSTIATFTGAGQVFQNVMHFRLDESGSATPAQYAAAMNAAFESAIVPAWLACISEDTELRSLKSKKVTGGGGPTQITSYAAGEAPGTLTGPIGNTSECPCLEFPVLLSGKNVTGKIFMGGIRDEDLESNSFAGSLRTSLTSLALILEAPITMAGALGTAHYTIFNRNTQDDQVVSTYNLGIAPGSQRRRLRPI